MITIADFNYYVIIILIRMIKILFVLLVDTTRIFFSVHHRDRPMLQSWRRDSFGVSKITIRIARGCDTNCYAPGVTRDYRLLRDDEIQALPRSQPISHLQRFASGARISFFSSCKLTWLRDKLNIVKTHDWTDQRVNLGMTPHVRGTDKSAYRLPSTPRSGDRTRKPRFTPPGTTFHRASQWTYTAQMHQDARRISSRAARACTRPSRAYADDPTAVATFAKFPLQDIAFYLSLLSLKTELEILKKNLGTNIYDGHEGSFLSRYERKRESSGDERVSVSLSPGRLAWPR